MRIETDIVIAGAGIIGLAVARAIKTAAPQLRVLIIEKEDSLGLHASGRNSGVIHAGFYYSPDSLKARFCRDGNRELRSIISKYNLPLLNTGKVVVTQNIPEVSDLENLYKRGLENGVDLQLLPERKLEELEPLARTVEKFIWSPNTGVSDPKKLINALLFEVSSLGVDFMFGTEVNILDRQLFVDKKLVPFLHFINCTGSQSDRIAQNFGVAGEYSMIPFLGKYRTVAHDKVPIRTLVYPIPHKLNPFLGVHLTLGVDGKVKIGPSAIPVIGREQYSWRTLPSEKDMTSSAKGILAMLKGGHHDFYTLAKSEIAKLHTPNLISAAAALVPHVKTVSRWDVKPPGIRSQLINRTSGKLEQDFMVLSGEKSTHVLNAVSPGWTSAFPFGTFVATLALESI